MNHFFSLLHVRPGERRRVFLSFAYLLSITSAFIIGRISRDTLVLEIAGAQTTLPYLYILLSVCVLVSVLFYNRLERFWGHDQLVGISLASLAFAVLCQRLLFEMSPLFYWVYYVWVDILGIIGVMQCWNMINAIFDSRQAKRLFALIGCGSVVANIVCGFGVRAAASLMGTQNLLFVVCFAILLALFFQQALSALVQSQRKTQSRTLYTHAIKSSGLLSLRIQRIIENRYLQILSLVVVMTFFVSTLVDYQFKILTASLIQQREARASFFGLFFGVSGLISLFIQLFVTHFVLTRFGVLMALLSVPVLMLVGAVMTLVQPNLFSIVWTKGAEHVFRYTIYDATIQLLYVPLATDLRRRAKSFADGVLRPSTIFMSGFFLLGTAQLVSTSQLSWFYILALLVWIALLVELKKEYVKTLIVSLRHKKPSYYEETLELQKDIQSDGHDLTQLVIEIFTKKDKESLAVLFDLIELHYVDPKKIDFNITAQVVHLIETSPVCIKEKAIRYLGAYGDVTHLSCIGKLMNEFVDTSDHVALKSTAILSYARLQKTKSITSLMGFLNHKEVDVRAAALVALVKYGGLDGIKQAASVIQCMATSEDARVRQKSAWILGEIGVEYFYQPLMMLFYDRHWQVRLLAIYASMKIKTNEFIPGLIYQLEHLRTASSAVSALAALGSVVIDPLLQHLSLTREGVLLKHMIPKVMVKLKSEDALLALIPYLKTADPDVRYDVLKAVNALHAWFPHVIFEREMIEQLLNEERVLYYELVMMQHDLNLDDSDTLMCDVLKGRCEHVVRRMVLLLGLIYPKQTIDVVYSHVLSTSSRARAHAVEILDNVLIHSHKKIIIPLVEEWSLLEHVRVAQEQFHLSSRSHLYWLNWLLEQVDSWLTVLAIDMIGRKKIKSLTAQVQSKTKDEHMLVRETAMNALVYLMPSHELSFSLALWAQDPDKHIRQIAYTLAVGMNS